jgi:hypothetical protein
MKPVPLDQVATEAPTDWLDAVLAAQATHTRPTDAGFSAAVLAALPQARNGLGAAQHARLARGFDLVTALAVGVCVAAVATLAPQALEMLANAPRATAWLAPDALEALLPPLALAAWLAWWSVRRAVGDR